MKYLLLLFSLLTSINIPACKCDTPTIKNSFESADFVFTVDIYDVNTTYKTGYWEVENSLAKAKIEKVYKSSAPDFRSKEITLFGQQFNSCDIIFKEKGKFLIFANVEPDTTFFYSSFCYATQEISQLSESEFALLEQLKNNFVKEISTQNNFEISNEDLLTAPDKVLKQFMIENAQLSEHHRKQKIYIASLSALYLLTFIIFILFYKKKKSN